MTFQKEEGYSDMQQVASAISGYGPSLWLTGAKHDYYYDECNTPELKKKQIDEYAMNGYGIILDDNQIERIYEFLEKEGDLTSNERFHAFKELAE